MLPKDRDFPARQFRIQALTAALTGRLYDGLVYDFQTECTNSGEYIPLRSRRPSVRYNICKIVVDDSVSMLFSEGHFPMIQCENEATRDALKNITKETRLNETMIEAATIGSVGSVAISMQVLRNRLFFKAMNTQYLTPVFDDLAPDTLVLVREKYKVKGADLAELGYDIKDDDLNASFWFQREWDDTEERVYVPRKVGDINAKLIVHAKFTTSHDLGFVPIVWIKNLPGGDGVDGACTFLDAVESSIEIDYQLSQAGRGLKYSADPQLVMKDPQGMSGEVVKGPTNVMVVGKDGDAKLLEINGKAAESVDTYVRTLREFALESIHGNRVSPDKIAGAQSGKAMELMNQSLVWLADRLRITYGEGGLLTLYRMIVKASQVFKGIECQGKKIGVLSSDQDVALMWNDWYEKTAADNLADAQTLTALTGASLISKETAIHTIADEYDIEDVAAEAARIGADQDDAASRQTEQMAAQAALAPKPAPGKAK